MRTRLIGAVLLALAACGTETVVLFSDEAATGGAAAAGGANSAASGAGSGSCPSGMARIGVDGEDDYCIDTTEVTRAAYADAAPTPADLPETGCAFKRALNDPGGRDDLPAVGLDWCDAHAFCRSQGKRLCGAIGGGATPIDELGSAARSQWHRACASAGANDYPYGDAFEPRRCNDGTGDVDALATPGTYDDCRGSVAPYDAVVDMSGNVHEWTDECEPEGARGEATTKCTIRGGVFKDTDPNKLRCGAKKTRERGDPGGDVGFRCCVDLAGGGTVPR